jgi:C-terminal processing protease CtpA/Prc
VYFERGTDAEPHDMDLVGLTLRPEADGSYRVIGIAEVDGVVPVDGVGHGDILLEVDGLEVTGATMGSVVDALRGQPGEMRTLVLDRDGERLTVQATVERLL